jgi:hypothetical protein
MNEIGASMLYRICAVAAAWAVAVVAVGGAGMLAMRFHARDFVDLLAGGGLAAAAGAIYVPVFALAHRLAPTWHPVGLKILAGTVLGLALSIAAAGLLMSMLVSAGGIKGSQPSRDFLVYLTPMLFLVPLTTVIAAATPARLLVASKHDPSSNT